MKYKNIFFLLIIIFLFPSLTINAATWKASKYIDETIDFTGEPCISSAYSLSLPYPGVTIAYGGRTGIYYASYDTTKNIWEIKTIEEGEGIGNDISLQIDSYGKPHISYTDQNKKSLKYAYLNNNGWNIQTLDEGNGIGRFCGLQLDIDQYPHIAYYDSNNGALKYIAFNGNEWKKEIIDKPAQKMVGMYLSFKIDKYNNRHISYYDATDDDLKYAYFDGYYWYKEVVDSTGITGLYTNLTLDEDNQPHISYYSNGVLKYANKDYWRWKYKIIDNNFGSGMYKSRIILDEQGNKHIFYYVNGEQFTDYPQIYGTIKHAYFKNEEWYIEDIKDMIGYLFDGLDFDINQDINGEICFFYSGKETFFFRSENYRLTKVIKPEFNISTNWVSKQIIDKNPGWHTFAFDSKGSPHIVYSYNYEYPKEELWHTWYDINIKSWNEERIERINREYLWSAYYPILQIDKEGQMHLVYHQYIAGDNYESTWLTYIKKNGDKWEGGRIKENIDNSWRVCFSLNNNNIPYISYYNSNRNLEITYQDSQGIWQSYIYNPDYFADESSNFSITIDNQNKLHLAYSQEYNLFYTFQKTDNKWETPINIDYCLDPWFNNIKLIIGNDQKKHLLYRRHKYLSGYYSYGNFIEYFLDEYKDKYAVSFDGLNWAIENIGEYTYRLSSVGMNTTGELSFISNDRDYKLYFYHLDKQGWEKEFIRDIEYFTEIDNSFKLYNNLPGFLLSLSQGELEYWTKISIILKVREQIGRTVVFDVITDGGKGIQVIEYQWNFEGDEGIQLRTTEPFASYTYPTSGKYKARVTVLMEDGARIVSFINVDV